MGTIGDDFFRGAQGNMRNATNAAAASAINDVPLHDGELVYIPTFRDYFALRKGSTATPDGTTVLSTLSGSGRWERLCIAHPSWRRETDWTIDFAAGADENTGRTGNALKTFDELDLRLGTLAKLSQVTTVTVTGNIPLSAPMRVSAHLKAAGLLRCRGTRTQVGAASTITAVTAISRASGGGNPLLITDTAGVLGANVGKRIRITAGARAGATAWIAFDLGSSQVQTSPFTIVSDASPVQVTPTNVTPVAGDAYVIETLSTVASHAIALAMDNDYATATQGVQAVWSDFDFRSAANVNSSVFCGANATAMTTAFLGCDLGAVAPTTGTMSAMGCRHHGPILYESQLMLICAGLITARISLNNGSQLAVDYDTLARGVTAFRSRNGSVVRVGTLGVFGATDGVLVECDAVARVDGPFSGVAGLYGSGNSGTGVKCEAGAKLFTTSVAALTITGTVGDAKLGGVTSGRAFDDSAGTYTAARTYSWANLALAVASGGFGSSMINPNNGAGVALKQ